MRRRSFLSSIVKPDEGWLSLLFLCGVVLSAVWSLEAAAWVERLDILLWVSLLAILAGLILAKSRIPPAAAHLLALLSGIAIVLYAVATTLPGHIARASFVLIWNRFDQWLGTTLGGGISTDNLLFLLLLAAIMWPVGYFGSWSVFRSRGPWWVILTSGSVLVVNVSYARALDVFALVYLFCSMLLVVRLNVAVQEHLWQRTGVEYSSEFAWHLVRSSLLIGAVVVGATWLAPTSATSEQMAEAWSRVNGPWQNIEAQFSRLFGGLQAKDQNVSSGFGKTLALRGATQLGDTAVLAVTGTEAPYLRGVVYERYTGQGWLAPERGSEQMLPNDARLGGNGMLLMREEVTATVKVLQPRGMTVLVPPMPLRVSLPVTAEYVMVEQPGQSGVATFGDVSVFRSSTVQRPGQQYLTVSSVSRADAKSLRQAGAQYPDDVKEHYLSVPRSVPNRVRALSQRLTVAASNPYDKAMTIQNYLRGYTYSDTVAPPPPGQDAVDYFLFDVRLGYCDYYASAMAVMLRSVGVPTRVVSGYSPGDYDFTQQAYVVRDANAHSWPEVYFPHYGWLPFEPTASRPAPARPEELPAVQTPPPVDPAEIEAPMLESTSDPVEEVGLPRSDIAPYDFGNAFVNLAKVLLPLAGVFAFAFVSLGFFWQRRFRGLAVAETAYAKLLVFSRWLGVSLPRQNTPHEHGRMLESLVPAAKQDIQLIVDQFVRQRFGRKPLAANDSATIGTAWERVRGRMGGLFWRRIWFWR